MINEIRAVRQKPPYVMDGGDCGAACIAGVAGVSIADVYDKIVGDRRNVGYNDLLTACYHMKFMGKVNWVTNELPRVCTYNNPEYMTFGRPSWHCFREWLELVDRRIKAGCVGFAHVNYAGNAMGDRRHQWYADHWVLIVGCEMADPTPKSRVLISCPSRDETFWKEPLEFLMNYGGYNIIWVRPVK